MAVEVIQPVPQKRIEERITEQFVDIPLPHIMEEMMEVSCEAVLVLTSCGLLSTCPCWCPGRDRHVQDRHLLFPQRVSSLSTT